MNSLCTLLTEAISNKFNIDATVFISKKKKHSLLFLKKKILYEYSNHRHIKTFIRKYFEERIMFCEPYVLNFPRLNQSIKWCHDYILATRKKYKSQKHGQST